MKWNDSDIWRPAFMSLGGLIILAFATYMAMR